MVANGSMIHQKRRLFIGELTPIFHDFYTRVSNSAENVSLDYTSQLTGEDFKEKLVSHRQRDMILGHTTVGIHRDELEMLLDGHPMKKVGSQCQNKTFSSP